MTRIAIALALCLGTASAAAQSDNTKAPDWKKTEKGAGELFRGIGQEINKLTAPKKDGKPEPKKEEKK